MNTFKFTTGIALFFLSVTALANVINHVPVSSTATGQRTLISVDIPNANNFKVTRLYFKSGPQANYNFIVLKQNAQGKFVAEIPAAGPNVNSIDYRIVTQTNAGVISKSPKYSVAVNPLGNGATIGTQTDFINVYSEHPKEFTDRNDFKDNINYTYDAQQVIAPGQTASASGTLGETSSAQAGLSGTSTGSIATATGLDSVAGQGATIGGITLSSNTLAALGVAAAGTIGYALTQRNDAEDEEDDENQTNTSTDEESNNPLDDITGGTGSSRISNSDTHCTQDFLVVYTLQDQYQSNTVLRILDGKIRGIAGFKQGHCVSLEKGEDTENQCYSFDLGQLIESDGAKSDLACLEYIKASFVALPVSDCSEPVFSEICH